MHFLSSSTQPISIDTVDAQANVGIDLPDKTNRLNDLPLLLKTWNVVMLLEKVVGHLLIQQLLVESVPELVFQTLPIDPV